MFEVVCDSMDIGSVISIFSRKPFTVKTQNDHKTNELTAEKKGSSNRAKKGPLLEKIGHFFHFKTIIFAGSAQSAKMFIAINYEVHTKMKPILGRCIVAVVLLFFLEEI